MGLIDKRQRGDRLSVLLCMLTVVSVGKMIQNRKRLSYSLQSQLQHKCFRTPINTLIERQFLP